MVFKNLKFIDMKIKILFEICNENKIVRNCYGENIQADILEMFPAKLMERNRTADKW